MFLCIYRRCHNHKTHSNGSFRHMGFSRMMQLLWTLALLPICTSFREQSIAVKGRLLCGERPAQNVRVKLWDEDPGPDPDDLLDQAYTNQKGEFHLKGGTEELSPIDPVLKVYHDCNDVTDIWEIRKPGLREVRFALPIKYITKGMVPNKTMDIGAINLEIEFRNEGRVLSVE